VPKILELVDSSRPAFDERPYRPVRTTVWLPESAGRHPVVLISHGTGGQADHLAWLASALNASGIAALGVDHHGNNGREPYRADGFARQWERPRDLSFALDQLLESEISERIDGQRVGAAGFSLGGYTVAALLGARIDPDVLLGIYEGRVPDQPMPEYPDLLDELRASITDPDRWLDGAGDSWHDDRVRAGFLMAPSILGLLDLTSVAGIDRPVEIRWGEADDNTAPPENALRYLELIPGAHGRPVGEGIGHYEFIHPDGDGAAICAEAGAEAVAFFRDQL